MAIKNYSSKKKDEIKYDVIEKLGVLSSDSKMPKELRVISWNGKDPVYDLRGWCVDEDGTEKMTKGITLTASELQGLLEILKKLDEDESEVE